MRGRGGSHTELVMYFLAVKVALIVETYLPASLQTLPKPVPKINPGLSLNDADRLIQLAPKELMNPWLQNITSF